MYKILALVFLCLFITASFAQNKASVKGMLADSLSKTPIEYATVAIVNAKDTSLISYTLSNKKGEFSISSIPTDRQTKMIVSYVGYQTITKQLQLEKGASKDFGTLFFSGNNLREVVIEGDRSPLMIKKDTIEFNTAAFKTRPNAVVEELLKKLPGVQVNTDGSILVNGKQISKLLIDGKQFFGNNPKIATQNLDADLIARIQVYDDRENDPNHKISASKIGKIINLKLKSKIKKSTIGKFYGGGGTRERYEAGGILSSFRDTLQISLIGLANNLSKTGFSRQDLSGMGGFNRSGGDQLYDGTFGGRGWGGLEAVKSTGFNINNDYGKKLKINLTYFYNESELNNRGKSFSEQMLTDTRLSRSSNHQDRQKMNKHALGGLIEWNPDTLNNIRYEPKITFNKERSTTSGSGSTFNTQEPMVSESSNNQQNDAKNTSFRHEFSYNKKFKKEGSSIRISHQLDLNKNFEDNYASNDLTSYVASLPSTVTDRYRNQHTKQNSANIAVEFTYPLTKKLFVEANLGASYISNLEHVSTFDKNELTKQYDLFLPDQSNRLVRNQYMQNLTPKLGYKFSDDYILKLGVNAQYQILKDQFNTGIPDRHDNELYWLPTLEFEGPSFSVQYGKDIRQPEISDLQPITREYGPLYKSIGNPGLQPVTAHEISGYYYKYFDSKQISINVHGNMNFSENDIVEKSSISENGATITTNVNRNGRYSASFGGNIGKQFKKSQNWQISLNTNFNANINRSTFFLNDDEGLQLRTRLSMGESVNFNYKSLMSINLGYKFVNSNTAYRKVDYETIQNYTHTIDATSTLRWPKKLEWELNYNYNYNTQLSEGFQKSANILNVAVSLQMLKKDRGQLKLSVYDLFDQNISIYRYASENSISTGESQILKRYLLLTYQYKLNIIKNK
jgi:hypothetical protein